MAEETRSAAGTASLLVAEGLIEMLRRKGVLDDEDVQTALRLARREAGRIPPGYVSQDKVSDLIGAMSFRAARRAAGRAD